MALQEPYGPYKQGQTKPKLTKIALKRALKYPLGFPIGFPGKPGSLGFQKRQKNKRKTKENNGKTEKLNLKSPQK